MSRITVQPAGPDRRVPIAGQPGAYFEQGVPKEVYFTRYIARRLADGDLVEVKVTAKTFAEPEGDR